MRRRLAVALEATRLAIGLASDWGSLVRAVYVVGDLEAAAQIDAAAPRGRAPAEGRLEMVGEEVLARVDWLGRQAGVDVETVVRRGEAFSEILREARAFSPDILVIGKTRRLGPGLTVIGTVTPPAAGIRGMARDRRSRPGRRSLAHRLRHCLRRS